jgi:SAM-dependent methyltransferase
MRRADYRADLAYVHHVAYSRLAATAAPTLLRRLRQAGIRDGRIVDLGCGGGVWLARLLRAGYAAVGVDSSPAMLALARGEAPGAALVRASVHDFELPACDGVTALGEVLSYIGDEGRPSLPRLFRRIARALRPGGLFVFDVLVGGPPMSYRTWRAGAGWAVLVEVEEDPGRRLLTRDITTFRRTRGLYRRNKEHHRVAVVDAARVKQELERAGFSVQTAASYGAAKLAPRRQAFFARLRGR